MDTKVKADIAKLRIDGERLWALADGAGADRRDAARAACAA